MTDESNGKFLVFSPEDVINYLLNSKYDKIASEINRDILCRGYVSLHATDENGDPIFEIYKTDK